METGKNVVSRETQEETGAEEGVHTVMGNKAEPTTSGDNGELWQRATTGPPQPQPFIYTFQGCLHTTRATPHAHKA